MGGRHTALAVMLSLLLAACDQPDAPPSPYGAGHCRALALHDEDGRLIVGVEDLAVDHQRGMLYLAAYNRRIALDETPAPSLYPGGLLALALDDLEQGGESLTVTSLTRAAHEAMRPHGLDLWIGQNGDGDADNKRILYSIDRAPYHDHQGRLITDRPRIIALGLDESGTTITHITHQSLHGTGLCHPNMVVALAPDRLLISNDLGSCSKSGRWADQIFNRANGAVALLDAQGATELRDDLAFANGLAVADHKGRPHLIIAETRGKNLRILDLGDARNPAPAPAPNGLPKLIALAAAPDNINPGDDGAFYIAALDHLLSYALFRAFNAPLSQPDSIIYRLELTADGRANLSQVLRVDGKVFPGATSAVKSGSHLIMGSAFGEGLAICTLHSAKAKTAMGQGDNA
ncbi:MULTISPECIES: hypothetical protein [unclassified Iodidimonas]|jgi:arylesterase/paraoxonase|uniref:hypothetical protein n=1 Tax=unclassified Iodidimonas TaxID=2626145 RepID=UPI0024828CB0|nr:MULTISPECIES: hypothetical protein [unclassified Iodidimonas]